MQVYRGIDEVPADPGDTVLVLGNFDGVHRGHQALLALGVERARAMGAQCWAVTFDPHPSKVLAPELAPPLLCTLEQRLARLSEHGADATVILRFDRALAATSPVGFVDDYLVRCGAREVVVGYDFSFGKDRAGTPEVLEELGAGRHVAVHVVAPVTLPSGLVPSSSKVRELVLEGRVDAAERLLGHPFEIVGPIVAGAGRGAGIGFPTANVQVEGEIVPGRGVYAVRARLGGEDAWRPGAANVGTSPTFGDGELRVEVHLFDFEGGSLRGRRLEVAFVTRLRAEKRFESVDALCRQIAADVARAKEILGARDAQR